MTVAKGVKQRADLAKRTWPLNATARCRCGPHTGGVFAARQPLDGTESGQERPPARRLSAPRRVTRTEGRSCPLDFAKHPLCEGSSVASTRFAVMLRPVNSTLLAATDESGIRIAGARNFADA